MIRDLGLRLRALVAPRRVERELEEEIAFHIERETRKHIEAGLGAGEARARARARFGSTALAADGCRDARGIAFVETGARDIVYAFRTFRRAPLVAVTIVLTVALGLGLVAVVFTFFNIIFFRVDAVRNPSELFAVEKPRMRDGQRVGLTRPEYEALRRETDIFVDVFAGLPDIDSRIDGRMMGGTLVTGNFFHVLGVDAARGRTLVPADDEPGGGRPVMVLSHKGWSRLFDNDPGIIGRRLIVNGFEYEIVGVMPEDFRGLSVGAPDYWAPLSLLGQVRRLHAGRENMVGIDVVGRLKPGLSRRTAQAGLALWASRRTDGTRADARAPAITLSRRDGTTPDSALEAVLFFTPIFFAFGLILMIGCANVANLLLARAVSRQREIGIRLSLGASRRRIVRQLLTESLLLALAAAALGLVISRVALEATIHLVSTTLPPELGENIRLSAPDADWRVLLFLVFAAMAATVFFGLMPALQATRLELVQTLRGEVTRDARPGRARNALIGVQVGASALLLISAAVFLRSALAAATVDPGFRTSDTVMVEIVNEPMRAAMIQAVAAEPFVAAVASSWPDALGRPREIFAEAATGRSTLSCRFVSPEYFDVLGIRVLRGRAFTSAEAASRAPVAVVSETTARVLWPNEEALGQVVRLEVDPTSEMRRRDEPPLPSRIFTIVGVFRDVPGFRQMREAGVYVPITAEVAETGLTVRVHGDPELARRKLLERLVAIDPNMGQVITLRTLSRIETYLLQLAFWLTLVLGGLALTLTLSGLFSVLSYLVEQRTKEIGVRMALGATARDVAQLVVSQSIRPIGVGLLAGTALAGGLATALMATDAAAQIGTSVKVFDPLAYGASLACIVAACVLAASVPALRAARIDPMATLREE